MTFKSWEVLRWQLLQAVANVSLSLQQYLGLTLASLPGRLLPIYLGDVHSSSLKCSCRHQDWLWGWKQQHIQSPCESTVTVQKSGAKDQSVVFIIFLGNSAFVRNELTVNWLLCFIFHTQSIRPGLWWITVMHLHSNIPVHCKSVTNLSNYIVHEQILNWDK